MNYLKLMSFCRTPLNIHKTIFNVVPFINKKFVSSEEFVSNKEIVKNNEFYFKEMKRKNELDEIELNKNIRNEFRTSHPELNEKIKEIDVIKTLLFSDIFYNNIKNNPELKIALRKRIMDIIIINNYNDNIVKLLVEYVDDKCNK